MIAYLLRRSSDPIVVTERVKMSAACFNLIAIGLLVGSAIGPFFNTALNVRIVYRALAVIGFILLECLAMFILSFLPGSPKQEED